MIDEMEIVQNEDGTFSAYDDTYDVVIHCETEEEQKKVIERLKSISWIPVDERLPEDERECLVTLEKVYGTPEIFMGIASYLKFGNDGYWNEKKYGYLEWDKYSDGHGGTKMYKVVAWMPQPELYRKEKNNE
jgi:hypothetical protein